MKHLDDLDLLGEKILRSMVNIVNYRPQTKLREGNVFRGVCLFTRREVYVTLSHDALDLTVPTPPLPDMGPEYLTPSFLLLTFGGHRWRHGPTPLATDILWPLLESCSNLFTGGPTTPTCTDI